MIKDLLDASKIRAGQDFDPVCTDDLATLCMVKPDRAKTMIIDMMLENREGMKLLNEMGALMFDGDEESFEVILQKHDVHHEDPDFKSEVIYDYKLTLSQCRGTDECEGSYVWKVRATTQTNGYEYETSFKNTLQKR